MTQSPPSRLNAAPRPATRPHPAWYGIGKPLSVLAALAVLAAGALAVTALTERSPRGHESALSHPHSAVPPASAPASPGRQAPGPAGHGAGLLKLVPGTELVNGLYLTYPHTEAGAVSAAVEFTTELGSTLDPDRAATIARLTADPSYAAAPQDAAAGVASTRNHLGLSTTGPLPPGTAVSLVPSMYQAEDVTSSQATVLLLFDYTTMAPAGISGHVGAMAATLRWTPGGWRLLKPAGPDVSGLIATPGSAAAAAKGWKAMTDGL